jgi:hypothetical protein
MSAPNTRKSRTPNVKSSTRYAERLVAPGLHHSQQRRNQSPLTAAKMLIAVQRATTQCLTVFHSVRGRDFAWPAGGAFNQFQFHQFGI